jgi:hypothetical protein
MYLMRMTRPDIAFALTQMANFVSNPGWGHWEALKQVFLYLAGTIHYGITYGGDRMNARLEAYFDAELAADLTKRKSTTTMCVSFHGGTGPVSCDREKFRYPLLTRSSTRHLSARETWSGSRLFLPS